MSLSEHVRTLGRGPGRARSLTRAEAADAMRLMLNGAAPEAVGALLMLLRMKGEVPEEIAGFAEAAQASLPDVPAVALDWPCYAAGRTRGAPWFLLSARLVADAGFSVLLHGMRPEPLNAGLRVAGIPLLTDLANVSKAFETSRIAFLHLEPVAPALAHLFNLRPVLGLRSCVNTVCRMLDPGRAGVSVQGVFHPSYRSLQTEASLLLGRRSLTVIKGGGGEFERHPGKRILAHGVRNGAAWEAEWDLLIDDTRRLNEVACSIEDLWSGTKRDAFAEGIVIGTAALALSTLGVSRPNVIAEQLWDARMQRRAA